MSTQIRFLPYQPAEPAAPTLAELQAATLVLDGAFIDVTVAFKQAEESMQELRESAQQVYRTNYETSGSFTIEYPITRREQRQVTTRLARAWRLPALIHNGRKPR